MHIHYLACSGHFYCNESSHNANAWMLLLIGGPAVLAIAAFCVWGVVLSRRGSVQTQELRAAAAERVAARRAEQRKNTPPRTPPTSR